MMEKKADFELTTIIGACGLSQVLITLTSNLAILTAVWTTMFMTFGAYNPGWACLDGNVTSRTNYYMYSNDSNPNNRSIAIEYEFPSKSPLYRATSHNLTGVEWSTDCSVRDKCEHLVFNPDSSTIVSEWDLSCESSLISSAIISIQMAGGFIGCHLGGYISNTFGRKTSIYIHLLIQAGSNGIAIFSTSWQMYATIAFFKGLGAAGVIATAYPYPLEFANGYWRGVIVSIPPWNISFLIFAVVVYFLRNWKVLHIISPVISAIVLITALCAPESVRWLTVKGRVDQAKKVVRRIALLNRHPLPDTRGIDNLAKYEKEQMGGHTYTYKDLFKTSEVRSLVIKTTLIWFTMASLYYGISFGLKSINGDMYINLIISAALEIPAIMCVAFFINKFGRRKSAMFYITVEIVCCFLVVAVYFLTSGHTKDLAVLILALFSKMMIIGFWGIYDVYANELFPTVLRTMSYGYLTSISNLTTIIAPYLFPSEEYMHISFICAGVLGIFALAITSTFEETKGKELKDIIGSNTINVYENNEVGISQKNRTIAKGN